ncbi:MAG TPA: hypothetical protein VFV86_07245, partial [Nitrososphaeraceae archaeon]|nr:hypothetical protein [Nitrososphaeraceae archaeon]
PKSFVGYLNENFDLKWKDKSLVKIESIKGYEIIKIFDKERELILSIDPILKKAILSENQKIIFEFNITQSEENEYYLQEFVPMTVEDFLDEEGDYIFGSLKVPIEELCWNLAYHCDRISEYEVSSEKKLEMSLLVNDENFIKSLMLVKKGVRSKMQMLDKILEMNTSSM